MSDYHPTQKSQKHRNSVLYKPKKVIDDEESGRRASSKSFVGKVEEQELIIIKQTNK